MGKKEGSRAQRRIDNRRMKSRAVAIFSLRDWDGLANATRNARLGDHIQHCSCHMCGNPRKHFGEVTMQEKRQALREFDE